MLQVKSAAFFWKIMFGETRICQRREIENLWLLSKSQVILCHYATMW